MKITKTSLLCSAMLFAIAQPANAWKPSTHLYVAQEAMNDAVDDGKVTIYKVDYLTGEKTGKLGDYNVDSNILQAMRNYPDQFRAGVLGPDAYPDIAVGQRVIHPETNHRSGSNEWAEYMWWAADDDPGNDRRATKAFATGFLTHISGDMFGHTFVNNYTGGEFSLGENAIKHIVLEGYVGKRTPDIYDHKGQRITSENVSIRGLEKFIYDHMINVSGNSDLRSNLYNTKNPTDGNITLPHMFYELRRALKAEINNYYDTKDSFDREIAGHLRDADDCGAFDFSCSATLSAGKAAAAQTEKAAYMAANAAGVTYYEHWVDDIDSGLRAWPDVSHKIAQQLVFNTSKSSAKEKVKAVQDIIEDYKNDHLISMLGAPDSAGAISGAFTSVMRKVEILQDEKKEIERNLVNFVLEKATGRTLEEYAEYISSPDKHFDRVMNSGSRGDRTILAKFNKTLGLTDTAYNDSSERFAIDDVPALHNTLTINKILLLGPSEVNRLLKDLGSTETLKTSNAMLGFIRTLDGGNEWQNHERKFVFAKDCNAYNKIFMKQTGENLNSCVSSAKWTKCATEGEVCELPSASVVRYGARGQYVYKNASDSIKCSYTDFGDPIYGTKKSCYYQTK